MSLCLEELTVRYGSQPAVDRVGLEIADGQVLALLGPSGCGKSTLLRAVAGLQPLAGGRIVWDGTDLARVPAYRRGFGLMFQDGALFPHRTVAGNVGYGLERRGVPRAQARSRALDLLELVGLAGMGERPIGALSGGQAQRVALARALAPRPRLLLLDEPLASLDRELRERLLADLRDVLRQTATSALFVTHDQGEAFAIADRLAVMRDGRLRQIGLPAEVWRQPADEWVAGFLGYSSIVDAAALTRVARLTGGPAARWALRPGAWIVRPLSGDDDVRQGVETGRAADVSAVCLAVMPGPEVTRLRVRIDGLGDVEALAGWQSAISAGDRLRVRFDRSFAAPLPADLVGQDRDRMAQ